MAFWDFPENCVFHFINTEGHYENGTESHKKHLNQKL